ncbi:MAG TPA: PilZ domain-containing protein, partial [Terriglobales bacterium]|nr:PilZ domain-containing protein [Terriglobales bacterium]
LMAAYSLILREHRRYFRHPIIVPVLFRRKQAGESFGRSLNISEGGLAVTTASPLLVGEQVTVEFALLGPPLHVKAKSKVCWHKDTGETGLSFVFLPPGVASELRAWLAQKLEILLGCH